MSEIEGKIIAHKILDELKIRVEKLRRKPMLSVVTVGNDQATSKYVSKKAKAAEYVGIDFYVHKFPENVSTDQLTEEIIRLQLRSDAVIVQLPLPKHVDMYDVLDVIDPDKDPDCLSSAALGRVTRGHARILPPTASAVMEIFTYHRIDLHGKHVVIVGQGELVGKPIASAFLNQPVTMTVCGLGTPKLSDVTKKADILITGTGHAKLITADMIKKGTIVIDCGVSFVDGKIVGDVDFEKVSKKARLVTPTPGGVGPITVAKLLANVVRLAEKE
jgi:methylenetetrahydrofolate dehydrogenase (NADP+) / methenyltetrahydrofolate cyclohydrolase